MNALSLSSLSSGSASTFFLVLGVVILGIFVLMIISLWKIFEKAGLAGWKSIIPFYNTYCLVVIAKLPWWYFLLALIPYLGLLVIIYVYYKISLAFGKSGFYAVGLMLLPIIFFPMLAFGDAQYDFTGVGVEEAATEPTVPGGEGNVAPEAVASAPAQFSCIFDPSRTQASAVEGASETTPQIGATV